ncbi:MAG: LuxR family transcriptional regulator [Phycisphaerales bacterium]|nr:MAG: LuxR family transcriptional regulator [Phycisphaerales bacterium]
MSIESGRELQRTLERTSLLTEALCGLPAVATLDWADLASEAMASIGNASIAVTIICSIDGGGVIDTIEAVGVASHSDQVESADLAGIRARADRLVALGFAPDLDQLGQSPLIGPAERLLGGRDWRLGPLGKVMGDLQVGGLLVGVGKLGEAERGRVLMTLIAPTRSLVHDHHVQQLGATLPLLVRRTLLAVGPVSTGTSNWLTEREQQVLDQLSLGKSVRQIADSLGRSPHTVHDHVKNLHRKLNASSRGELIARALGHLPRGTRIRHRGADAIEIAPKPFASQTLRLTGTEAALNESEVARAMNRDAV